MPTRSLLSQPPRRAPSCDDPDDVLCELGGDLLEGSGFESEEPDQEFEERTLGHA